MSEGVLWRVFSAFPYGSNFSFKDAFYEAKEGAILLLNARPPALVEVTHRSFHWNFSRTLPKIWRHYGGRALSLVVDEDKRKCFLAPHAEVMPRYLLREDRLSIPNSSIVPDDVLSEARGKFSDYRRRNSFMD